MRERSDKEKILSFIRALGRRADREARVYFTGGATAVLIGWRHTTIDVDVKIVPESDHLLRAIPEFKESLKINVELAAPDDFIPPLEGWQDRSQFIVREETLSFYHYDFYAQALAKIERWHPLDLEDVKEFFKRDLIQAKKLLEHYNQIEPLLYRYPSIDARSFRSKVEEFVNKQF